jgi:glycogen operon protein
VEANGVNTAVVSRHAVAVYFCLFDSEGAEETYRFRLPHRLGDVHFGFIEGVAEGARYGFRADGPFGGPHRFDMAKLLVDPYATAIDRPYRHMPELTERGSDTAALVPKAIVRKPADAARPLPTQRPDFIYELSVKAFTKLHPEIPEALRGTVAALGHPAAIAHFKRIGTDCLELMPLMAWIDERHLAPLGLANAWGYNPVTFMAPDPRLSPGGFSEIRETVSELHRHGIRVVLDVVFNHTGESDDGGATLSLRGLDNALYFTGRNDSGCGNTLACERALVVQLVVDALRCWVNETGLDGFRFDLATVMGHPPDAPLIAAISQDPVLKDLILIAEPWDVSAYRLGGFPANWLEWNDRYRDDVRRFWRGDAGSINALATRITGSSDIFAPHRPPSASINYLAAHDGFTLADVTRYAAKQNDANGEGNRDGNAHEPTWPGGDVRALLATLFLSRGTAMLTAGDEFGRSQNGNNNAYAQDNATTWLDWNTADQSLIDFTANLVKLRRSINEDRHLADSDAKWFGPSGRAMDWNDSRARTVGVILDGHALWINGGDRTLPVPGGWRRDYCSAAGKGLPPQSVSILVKDKLRQAGASDEEVTALAATAGISRDWWEVDGTHHDVPIDTLRHILAGLQLPCATADEVHDSKRRLAGRTTLQIAQAGEAINFGATATARRRFTAACDDGSAVTMDVKPGEQPSAKLALGCWLISTDDGTMHHVLVRPEACFMPSDIAAGKKVFGLSSHLYALHHAGDGGIGDFETLRQFAGLTTELGGRYSGINPLHHMFPADRARVSPYQPSDRRYLDPIYISIAQLLSDHPLPETARLAASRRAAFAALEKLPAVDYIAHWQAKSELLECAFAEWRWPIASDEDLVRHGAFEAERAGENVTPERIRYRAFLETVARQQLAKAAERNTLYRDLALGCAFDGGEIAEDPAAFVATVSLGAPPDPFARNGQVWNLPAFSPLELEARGLAPMQAILAANMRCAAALRIDHILGFARQFWVPRGAEGRDGAYVRFPMDALIALTAIESQRSKCLIVGEDLGTVPDGLRQAMDDARILSYRVLWFERDGEGFRKAEDYPQRALACLASHDLPTFKGWRRATDIAIEENLGILSLEKGDQRRSARQRDIATLDAMTGNTSLADSDASVAAHAFVARTPSAVMLIQADDLAQETDPLNVPGTDTERPNWRRRLAPTIEELAANPFTSAVSSRVKEARNNE